MYFKLLTNVFGHLKSTALNQTKYSIQPKPEFISVKDARDNLEPKVTVNIKDANAKQTRESLI